jgi:hypothetical protein
MPVTFPSSIFPYRVNITRLKKHANETNTSTAVVTGAYSRVTVESKRMETKNGPIENLVNVIEFRGDIPVILGDRIEIVGGNTGLEVRKIIVKTALNRNVVMTTVWCW